METQRLSGGEAEIYSRLWNSPAGGLATKNDDPAVVPIIDDSPDDRRHAVSRARLIQKVYEVDSLECTRCGATLRIIALIRPVCLHTPVRQVAASRGACRACDRPIGAPSGQYSTD